jgi:transposase
MPATKPAYTEEFKRDVLAYQASTTENQRRTASHFGITPATLRAWQRRAQTPLGASAPVAAMESPEQELRRLRRENRALLMRCEILKKTVGIFSEANARVSRESKP